MFAEASTQAAEVHNSVLLEGGSEGESSEEPPSLGAPLTDWIMKRMMNKRSRSVRMILVVLRRKKCFKRSLVESLELSRFSSKVSASGNKGVRSFVVFPVIFSMLAILPYRDSSS